MASCAACDVAAKMREPLSGNGKRLRPHAAKTSQTSTRPTSASSQTGTNTRWSSRVGVTHAIWPTCAIG